MTPLLGYTPHDLFGKPLWDICHPEDVPSMREAFEQVLKLKGQRLTVTTRWRTVSDDWLLMRTCAYAFHNPYSDELEFVIAKHIPVG